MAINLSTLADSLSREISPPGTDAYPSADYPGMLTDAFWEIRLFGFLDGFEEDAASRGGPDVFGPYIVTPLSVEEGYDAPDGWATSDLGRDRQQLVVLWAAWKNVLLSMQSLNTMFRAKAGPVEYETQNSATVLKAILDQLKGRIDFIIANLSAFGRGSGALALDVIIERSYSEAAGDTWWVR